MIFHNITSFIVFLFIYINTALVSTRVNAENLTDPRLLNGSVGGNLADAVIKSDENYTYYMAQWW